MKECYRCKQVGIILTEVHAMQYARSTDEISYPDRGTVALCEKCSRQFNRIFDNFLDVMEAEK